MWLGVSRVCRLGVSAGCVAGVSAGCVAGACRVCRGRVPGVLRVCQGCVAGVGRVCGSVPRVCARPAGSSVPRGPRPPPLPSAPVPSRLRVSSTRVCAPACRSRETGCGGFLVFSACGRPPGDFLFSASRVPWDFFLFFPPGIHTETQATRARCRPLGTSSSGISPGIQRHARQTRVWFSPCAPHGAFIRRPPHTRLRISPSHSTPNRTAAHATPNLTPPQKTPPRPSGTQHTARNGCRAST